MEFFVQNWYLFLALLVSGGMLAWPVLMNRSGGATVSTLQATQLINKGALVIDVRQAEEVATGTLKDARHIPLADLAAKLPDLQKYKAKPVVVCCATGARSARAVGQMRKQGFTDVYNLEGGIGAWKAAGLPLK